MRYFITFLEGVISFISPCMLPMLPIYISYFTGGSGKKAHIFIRSLSFAAGFTVVFCAMGLFAGTIGAFLTEYRTALNIICGAVVVVFGLSCLEIIPLNFLKGISGQHEAGSVISAFLFGIVYSVSLTPCVGAFLGSALMLAAGTGGAAKGLLLLFVYSMGLGIPFVLSAVLIERLRGAFALIKRHYRTINTVCGVFLIAVGISMAFGWINRLISILS